jgi:tetraprenyl-beta-curcumene synthase
MAVRAPLNSLTLHRSEPQSESRAELQRVGIGDRLVLQAVFAGAARRYWTGVFPHVRRECSHWRQRAIEIPDPVLRRLALEALGKRGNLEGAAAFAAFAPRSERATLVRAVVAFQAAYDYLDLLAEQAQPHPVTGARALHAALLDALDPWGGNGSAGVGADRWVGTESPGWMGTGGSSDYYASYPQREDGGYLAELVDRSRAALATLPSFAAVAPAARRAAKRIVEFQSLNLARGQGDHEAFERWARTEIPPATDLRWWEVAGGGGSPLCVYALTAAAADPATPPGDVESIEHAYFPWIGGLHSLLDHLVDETQDAACGQRNLLDYYSSPQVAAVRMEMLAERAASAARALPRGHQHTIVLAGMAGYYLSDPEASVVRARKIARGVREAVGGPLTPTLLVFKARRLAGRPAVSRGLRSAPAQRPAVRDERDSPVAMRL